MTALFAFTLVGARFTQAPPTAAAANVISTSAGGIS